jgi:uncharacterized protein YgfB (UPF0149 family)
MRKCEALLLADHDLMVIRELRKIANEAKAAMKIAPRTSDEQLKWLNWPEFVTVSCVLCYKEVTQRSAAPQPSCQ